jgi:ABC-type antimicrobial peptide transport system permease subunit
VETREDVKLQLLLPTGMMSYMQQKRIVAALTASFGVLAPVLACIGLYGVMTYFVAQRTSEIGIRMAMDALPREVLTGVLREATWMTSVGITCGIGAIHLSTRLVKLLPYGLHPNDPVVLTACGLLLPLIGVAATCVPARRAAANRAYGGNSTRMIARAD